jgi:hypothetical protein
MSRRKPTHYQLAMEHEQRMTAKRERIQGLRALMLTHEDCGNWEEAQRLAVKIRLVEQQLRYMDR